METTHESVVAALRVGAYYTFNFGGCPPANGTFEGVTDFGWFVFTTEERGDTETKFYNPALLCTIRPETFDSIIAG